MATTAPSADHLPLIHRSSSQPPIDAPPFSPLPPDYYAPLPPPSHTARSRSRTSLPRSERSVRFRSPAADPPRDAPDNHSLLPPYTPPRKNNYKGHKSEAEYLAALRAWADEKSMMQPGEKSVLPGFYGRETMEECIEKNPKLRLRGGRRERRAVEREEGKVLRGEGAVVEVGADDGEGKGPRVEEVEGGESVEPRRRKSGIGGWLSRKRTN